MAEAKPSKVPTTAIVWAGLGVLAIFFGKQLIDTIERFFRGIHKDPSIEPTNEPTVAAKTGVLTAVFDQPANNGNVYSSTIPFAGIKLKVAINNPTDEDQTVDLKVSVTWYPRVWERPTTSQATKQMKVPPGRSTHDVYVSRPFTLFLTIDAVAMAEINGRSTGTVLFEVD